MRREHKKYKSNKAQRKFVSEQERIKRLKAENAHSIYMKKIREELGLDDKTEKDDRDNE